MAREPEAMRVNMEAIRLIYPDKIVFKPSDVCKITGLSINTVKKHFVFMGKPRELYISIGDLARQMSYTKA